MKKIKKLLFRIWEILRHPAKTYQEVYNEGLKEAMLYFLTILVILTVIMLILGAIFFSLFIAQYLEEFPLLKWISFPSLVIFIPISGFILLIISGLILHLFVRLLGGRQGFKTTLKTCAYSSTPLVLSFWFLPLIIITTVWSIILTIIGIQEMQKISKIRAIGSVLLPPVVIAAISFALKMLL